MTSDLAAARLLPWTIPKPMGLRYQAFVVVGSGVYITPELDVTSFEEVKVAATEGAEAVQQVLTEHGRSKRAQYIPFGNVAGVAANDAAGTVHLKVRDGAIEDPMVRIPNREQLPKVAKALSVLIDRWRESQSSPE